MLINFRLYDLKPPQFSPAILQGPLRKLQEIADQNQRNFEQGHETKQFKNRKAELIQRLKNRFKNNESFAQATNIIGRERLLISIYIDYEGRGDATEWLPELNIEIAKSILGDDGQKWHIGRKRQAALLFFTLFDRISGLSFVCERLREAYFKPAAIKNEQETIWHYHSRLIFDVNGTGKIADQKIKNEPLDKLMSRFFIPKEGCFAEKLRQSVLLNEIKKIPFGAESPKFAEIETLKEERGTEGLLLGSAALRILLQRVTQIGGKWPDAWRQWIIRFGCDPRYGRGSPLVAKWWGWATPKEFLLAQQGVTGLTVAFFIEFLKNSLRGTEKEQQFKQRSQFLLNLLMAGKIQNARMLLNPRDLAHLDRKYHDPLLVAELRGAANRTSMICLSCKDDIYIIEGTHSFGLRMFHRSFPIADFWGKPKKYYTDHELRISPHECPVFIRHVSDWTDKFFYKLRMEFHVEWNDVLR